ncbi:MAG: mechanosensitive ion channel [Deltaproteobacteria bacterium]|nr:mechanosensitive ion channel [Deltaproteobacteria bacterium]
MWKVTDAQIWETLGSYAWRVIVAGIVVVVGIFVVKRISRIVTRQLTTRNVDPTIVHFSASAIQVILYGLVIIDALHRLGVQSTSLIALVGAAGFGLGLALKGQLANVSAGLLMILFRPFNVGHYIQFGKTEGTVEKIELMNTQIRTPDNIVVIVPNAKLVSATILNYSLKDTRRLLIVVRVSYEADLNKVRDVLQKIIDEDDRILKDRSPVIAIRSLGENSVKVLLRLWVKSADHWKVEVETTEKIKHRFDAEGIPFPTQQSVPK